MHSTGAMPYKTDIILEFTQGRTSSARELTESEAVSIVKYLEKFDPCDRMRKKIFAICHTIGWLYDQTDIDRKLNQAKIDAFIKRYGYLKKALNKYSRQELPKLVSQFEAIQKKVDKERANKAVDKLLSEIGITTQ